MRNETVEIVDTKGQKLQLQISTPSIIGLKPTRVVELVKDHIEGQDGIVKAKLTGWDKNVFIFEKRSEGNWKTLDKGFLRYHTGKTYLQISGGKELVTKDLYLLNSEGTWGLKLFNYQDHLGGNRSGEGTAPITWVTGFAEGRFSWSIV